MQPVAEKTKEETSLGEMYWVRKAIGSHGIICLGGALLSLVSSADTIEQTCDHAIPQKLVGRCWRSMLKRFRGADGLHSLTPVFVVIGQCLEEIHGMVPL